MRRSVHPPEAISAFRYTALLRLFCLAVHALAALAILNWLGGAQ